MYYYVLNCFKNQTNQKYLTLALIKILIKTFFLEWNDIIVCNTKNTKSSIWNADRWINDPGRRQDLLPKSTPKMLSGCKMILEKTGYESTLHYFHVHNWLWGILTGLLLWSFWNTVCCDTFTLSTVLKWSSVWSTTRHPSDYTVHTHTHWWRII